MATTRKSSGKGFDFSCDWRHAVNLDPQIKATMGYILSWSGCGGLNLPKDLELWNPFTSAGQTVVSGRTFKSVGLIESLRYEGGPTDPIRMVAYVRETAADGVQDKVADPLPSTKVKVGFYIISYDNESMKWYEAAYIKDQSTLDANLDTVGGEVQLFIEDEPTRVADDIDLEFYRLEFQIIPALGSSAEIEFATGPTRKRVRSWAG